MGKHAHRKLLGSKFSFRHRLSTFNKPLFRLLLDTAAPQLCLLCRHNRSSDSGLCTYCSNSIRTTNHACIRCALPLVNDVLWPMCGRCIRGETQFNRCIAACIYSPSSQHLVNRAKHHRDVICLKPLINKLQQRLMNEDATASSIDALIPVPMHPRRLRQRGFNQAIEIARPISRQLARPILHDACWRLTDNPPQQQLSAKQRQLNLRRSFQVDNAKVTNKHIAIIDDVVTTGATANAIAETLYQAGAATCDVWCLVRTPLI